jgi:hypothetical protein
MLRLSNSRRPPGLEKSPVQEKIGTLRFGVQACDNFLVKHIIYR